MRIDAFLCDSVRVRESLLHVLGGGVTRLTRPAYPAALGLELAVLVTLEKSELSLDHKLRIAVMGQDGEQIATVEGLVRAEPNPAEPPDYAISVQLPMRVDLAQLALPAPGIYSVHLTMNNTNLHSVTFKATTP